MQGKTNISLSMKHEKATMNEEKPNIVSAENEGDTVLFVSQDPRRKKTQKVQNASRQVHEVIPRPQPCGGATRSSVPPNQKRPVPPSAPLPSEEKQEKQAGNFLVYAFTPHSPDDLAAERGKDEPINPR